MLFLLLFTTAIAIIIAVVYRKIRSLPPGPFPYPIIGNAPQLGYLITKHGGVMEALKELRKQYGPVFTLWFGPIPSVHICNMEIAQATMVKRGNEFADRYVPSLWDKVNGGLGIINSSGPYWAEQRRFTFNTLRNFGFGKGIMEEHILGELDLRCQDLDKKLDKNSSIIFDPTEFFELMVGSVINRMMMGVRFEGELEKKFFELKHELDAFTADFGAVDFFADYEILWKIPYFNKRWTRMVDSQANLCDFLREQIKKRLIAIEHGEKIIGDQPEDYVDAFILKMKEDEASRIKDTTYTLDSLVFNLLDLWSAGQESTTITLRSGFQQMIEQPEIIFEARKELLAVTKSNRHLSLQDRSNTPYFNALCTEMQRVASILSINIFRKASGDTMVGDYLIPDGTVLTAEISVLMADDAIFEQPEKFDPTRFMRKPDLEKHVVPFGLGKRACPGESLTKAELYLLTGNLLLRYDFKKVSEVPIKDCVNVEGFFKTPPPFEMQMIKL